MIRYFINEPVVTEEVIEVFSSSGIRRPIHDKNRIGKMLQHANLIITARDGEKLVGISRALTDYCFCCYLSDLAVSREHQKQGIGRELLRLTRETIGPQSMLLLLSAPEAMEYYPKLEMKKVENGFIYDRTEN